MPIVRPSKIEDVARETTRWLEEYYSDEEETLSVGHVIIVFELRSRHDDPTSGSGRSTAATIATYADDSRGWVQRALLKEALDGVDQGPVFIEFEPPEEEES